KSGASAKSRSISSGATDSPSARRSSEYEVHRMTWLSRAWTSHSSHGVEPLSWAGGTLSPTSAVAPAASVSSVCSVMPTTLATARRSVLNKRDSYPWWGELAIRHHGGADGRWRAPCRGRRDQVHAASVPAARGPGPVRRFLLGNPLGPSRAAAARAADPAPPQCEPGLRGG